MKPRNDIRYLQKVSPAYFPSDNLHPNHSDLLNSLLQVFNNEKIRVLPETEQFVTAEFTHPDDVVTQGYIFYLKGIGKKDVEGGIAMAWSGREGDPIVGIVSITERS
ncbi:MAG: hypothetical protein QXX95_05010 [Nitrososphaerales archaeon]